MKIIELLHSGHELTLGKLLELETMAGEFKKGGADSESLQKLEGLTSYFNEELDRHFRQEEMALFPVMAKFIGRAGFIHAMLDEHQSFWRAVETLEERASLVSQKLRGKKVSATDLLPVEQVLTHIVAFLRSHITKEEKSFFPLVEKSLDTSSIEETEQLLEQLQSVHS